MPWTKDPRHDKHVWAPPRVSNTSKILLAAFCFRLANAAVVKTFFQPDEYFQSLEPAWLDAFGSGSGPWITWEWKQHLRSSLHPYLFAAAYRAAALITSALGVGPHQTSQVLLAAPRVVQAAIAALIDCYTIRLGGKYADDGGKLTKAAAILVLCSPWQWYVSTRTLVNSLETALTAGALYHWPWELVAGVAGDEKQARGSLRKALLLAAFASILRAPNVVLWVVIAGCSVLYTWYRRPSSIMGFLGLLVKEGVGASLIALGASAIADYRHYGSWTFPPLRFLQFNVVQSLAVFYGRNRPDYYLTEGLPLILTTALPFVVIGVWTSVQPLLRAHEAPPSAMQRLESVKNGTLTSVVAATVVVLSLISHKEARFIYPLLPILVAFGAKGAVICSDSSRISRHTKATVMATLLAANIALGVYVTTYHQRGVIDVMHHLRGQYEQHHLPSESPKTGGQMTVGFLMPCHSTPWRSHLVHPGIRAWALTCEPPLHLRPDERDDYLDEADEFYADPSEWLSQHMASVPSEDESDGAGMERRAWPEHIVFFAQLEPVMKERAAQQGYERCWRGFNSHWHDDWRRQGDVIVWCLHRHARPVR